MVQLTKFVFGLKKRDDNKTELRTNNIKSQVAMYRR